METNEMIAVIYEKIQSIEIDVSYIKTELMDLKHQTQINTMAIENDIRKGINIIGEAHSDLLRNLHQTQEKADKNTEKDEIVKIKMELLEDKVKQNEADIKMLKEKVKNLA